MSNLYKTPVHGAKRSDNDDVDLVDKLLNETGCADLHYRVQECIAETKDWRKCQTEVRNFRNCIDMHEKRKLKMENLKEHS